MLFKIRHTTPEPVIYRMLNDELIHFLEASINATRFSKGMFSDSLKETIWSNSKTKDAFKALWDTIRPLDVTERQRLHDEIESKQDLPIRLTDRSSTLPDVNDDFRNAIKTLTGHLFSATSKLTGIEAASGQTVKQHYDSFINENGKVCCACGSKEITEHRTGITIEEQWRGPYDHYLAHKHYPYYGTHPENLIPCCDVCNSKAKHEKDLIHSDEAQTTRRLAFYPTIEAGHPCVEFKVEFGATSLKAYVELSSNLPDTSEKLETWDTIYSIKSRISGKFSDLMTILDTDCSKPESLDQLRANLNREAETLAPVPRSEPYHFWKHKLYTWLAALGDPDLKHIYNALLARRDDAAAMRVYGLD